MKRFIAALALLVLSAQSPDLPTIRLGTAVDDAAMPLFYAQKAGIYKKYGLNVDLGKFSGAAAVAAALVGGALELGKGSTISVVNAYGKGLPLTIIGNMVYYDASKPDVGLLVAADGPIKTPKDLEGATLGAVAISDLNSISTMAWMDAHGVDRTTVKFVEVPASSTVAAIQQKRITAMTTFEPYYSADTAGGQLRSIGSPYDAIAKRFAAAVLFGNVSWVNAHHDLVDKFLRATQEAALYLQAHPDELSALDAEVGGVDPATTRNMHHPDRGVPTAPSDIQPIIDAAAKYKIIPAAFPASDIICSCALHK